MVDNNTQNLTSPQVKTNPKNNNPQGKGGFIEHPENINIKGTIKTPAYWINFYGEMTAQEVVDKLKEKKTNKTMFEEIALAYLVGARTNPKERKDFINRVDGTPKQNVDVMSGGEKLQGPLPYLPSKDNE